MTSGDFFERIDELDRAVGHGDLEVKNEVDQVYAAYIEFGDGMRHPRGGQAHYARDGLYNGVETDMGELARRAITEDGSDLAGAAIDIAQALERRTSELTPREFVNLARSGHVTVTDDGVEIYDRPPDVPRLSEAQLRAQRASGHEIDFGADTNPRLEMP